MSIKTFRLTSLTIDETHFVGSASANAFEGFVDSNPASTSHAPKTRPPGRTLREVLCVAALLILFLPSIRHAQGAEAASPAVESRKDQVIPLNNADTLDAEFLVGTGGKIGLSFKFADAKTQTLLGTVKPDVLKRQVVKDGKKVTESVPMPDGLIEFRGEHLDIQYHSRPNLARYTEAQQGGLAQVWETLPGASQCWVPLEIRADHRGAELWMAGRYCGRLVSESRLTEMTIKLEAGGEIRNSRTFARAQTGMFLPLDVRNIARPGVMKNASVSLKAGTQQVKSVPMTVADAAGNADVAMARLMQGSRFLETNEYTSRTSLDAMPESLHFSVPQAFYHRAWVLCAVDADPKKDPILTTRLTRFAVAGRGGAIADTTIALPRGQEKPGDAIQRVGDVQYVNANGEKITTPLYLVRVDLKTGDILDLIADTNDPYAAMKIGPYLDFEFLGKCGGLEVQHDRRREPLASSISAVHVFGVTLEKSPVELRLSNRNPATSFITMRSLKQSSRFGQIPLDDMRCDGRSPMSQEM